MWLCDSDQLVSGQWCVSQWPGLGVPGTSVPSGGDFPAPLYPMLQAGDGAVEVRTVPVAVVGGLQVDYFDDATAVVTAAAAQAGRVSYEVWAAGALLGTVEDVYGFGGVAPEVQGAASMALDAVSVSAGGVVSSAGAATGNADFMLDGVTVNASGTLGPPPAVVGGASIVLDPLTSSASGGVLVQGTADIDLADLVVTAAGRLSGIAPPISLRPTARRGLRGRNLQRATRRPNR